MRTEAATAWVAAWVADWAAADAVAFTTRLRPRQEWPSPRDGAGLWSCGPRARRWDRRRTGPDAGFRHRRPPRSPARSAGARVQAPACLRRRDPPRWHEYGHESP